jgi:ribosome-binding protein aMBF1 (putative translation factor)
VGRAVGTRITRKNSARVHDSNDVKTPGNAPQTHERRQPKKKKQKQKQTNRSTSAQLTTARVHQHTNSDTNSDFDDAIDLANAASGETAR